MCASHVQWLIKRNLSNSDDIIISWSLERTCLKAMLELDWLKLWAAEFPQEAFGDILVRKEVKQ